MYKIRPWIKEEFYYEKNEKEICRINHPGIVPIVEEMIKNRPNNVDWIELSLNPAAIDILSKNVDKINWWNLNKNPEGIKLLKLYPEKIFWNSFACNTSPEAIEMINKFIENHFSIFKKIWNFFLCNKALKDYNNICWESFWYYLSQNPAAVPLLKKYKSHIVWRRVSENPSPEAIKLLFKENPEKINWSLLCENPAAIDFLKKNPDKIILDNLCRNTSKEAIKIIEEKLELVNYNILQISFYINIKLATNPSAIHILEKYENIISFSGLILGNPAAIDLLEKNINKVIYKSCFSSCLFSNPGIFVYDYEGMTASRSELREEIIRAALHPKRIDYYLSTGADLDDIYFALV